MRRQGAPAGSSLDPNSCYYRLPHRDKPKNSTNVVGRVLAGIAESIGQRVIHLLYAACHEVRAIHPLMAHKLKGIVRRDKLDHLEGDIEPAILNFPYLFLRPLKSTVNVRLI